MTSGNLPTTLAQRLAQLEQRARERAGPNRAPARPTPALPRQARLPDIQKCLAHDGEQQAERTQADAETGGTAAAAPAESVTPAKRHLNGHANQARVAAAAEALDTVARQRGLEQTALCATSEYPTTLTRLPIFPPVTRETAIETCKRGWVQLHSAWDGGGVFRSGPALNVYDEDTLLGLMMLRSSRLTGPADHMPTPVRRLDTDDKTPKDERVHVDAVVFTMSQLESTIHGHTPKNGWGGRTLARRRQSIEDLSGLQLRFEKLRDGLRYQRVKISLFDISGFSKERDACYYVQFHPLVSRWLEGYHTFVDFALRRKLSDLGKAIHRFLASQRSNKSYRIKLDAMYEAIGAQDNQRKLRFNTKEQLEIMRNDGWIACFMMTGTGRASPFYLELTFATIDD